MVTPSAPSMHIVPAISPGRHILAHPFWMVPPPHIRAVGLFHEQICIELWPPSSESGSRGIPRRF